MNAHSKSVQEPRDISQEVNERVARPTGGVTLIASKPIDWLLFEGRGEGKRGREGLIGSSNASVTAARARE